MLCCYMKKERQIIRESRQLLEITLNKRKSLILFIGYRNPIKRHN